MRSKTEVALKNVNKSFKLKNTFYVYLGKQANVSIETLRHIINKSAHLKARILTRRINVFSTPERANVADCPALIWRHGTRLRRIEITLHL